MTYFGFLLRFLFIPIAILLAWAWYDQRRGKTAPAVWRSWPMASALLLHVVIAVVYTTPWDNYLVATRVWWYDPQLVTGLVIGWVPIEEYTFFVVQPIMAGLWLFALARYIHAGEQGCRGAGVKFRVVAVGVTAVIWLTMVGILAAGWKPGTYLALELGWALPPIMLQLGFGADILWQHRRLVFWTIVPMTLYLSGADALAIHWGTWTIDPAQSLHVLLGGVLPVEEFLFFLLTNVLLTFGVVLLISAQSHERLKQLRHRWQSLATWGSA
jgi:lycopene cyclase domain-containing protein